MRDRRVGVIGLGYVGLPLLLDFCAAGLNVIGFDIDGDKVEDLNNGRSYISYISGEVINNFIKVKRFEATTDFIRLKEV